jgi:hypothetical protein
MVCFIAAIALLVTALLAVGGYLLQNKISIAADATQHEIVTEAADRQREEDKALLQLDRVQAQNAEHIYPLAALSCQFAFGHNRAAHECGFQDFITTYSMQWVSPPTQPYVTLLDCGKPEFIKAMGTNPFFYIIPPEDLARLSADPVKQARWVTLATHTLIPPVRDILLVIQTKVCCTRQWRHEHRLYHESRSVA